MDCVYNWIVSYFDDRAHTTKFEGEVSSERRINASVVQGSSIGPASFSIAESDLQARRKEFDMFKFADDVDLVSTLDNYHKIQDEMDHIASWAADNNLILNKVKTREVIFVKGRGVTIPPATDGRERVSSFKKLGVILQSNLSMKEHVDALITAGGNMLYALNILKHHGMNAGRLQQVFYSKVVSKFLYASPAWCGMAGQEEKNRIDSFLRRSKKYGFYPEDGGTFEELCDRADDKLLSKIENNPDHVLYKFLPAKQTIAYNLRQRPHNYTLPDKDNRNFINRIIYKYIRN
jgi:hypothetical protein